MKWIISVIGVTLSLGSFAQLAPIDYFSDIHFRIDTSVYRLNEHTIFFNGEKQLYFEYNESNPVVELRLFPSVGRDVSNIKLLPSTDYTLVDSIVNVNDRYIGLKVRFLNLNNTSFLALTFQITDEARDEPFIYKLPLFPYTRTYVKFYPGNTELYIGEEKIFELVTNNIENIRIDNTWTEGQDINYRLSRNGNQLLLHVIPNKYGRQQLEVDIYTKKPYLNEYGRPVYRLDPIVDYLMVRASRLAFLGLDRNEISLPEDATEAIEVQLDYNRNLEVGKTYRIENQEEPGGALIAELYTKSRLTNDKVLALLRAYAYHRQSSGYLYLKDGDVARFITNVDITPQPNIEKISILREGKDWSGSNKVYPGETVEVRIEGEGLHKTDFRFQGAQNIQQDSIVKNENVSIHKIKIPIDIASRRIEIFNYNEATGKSLNVTEYERPRPFDFIKVDLGDQESVVSNISRPILYDETLQDVVLEFMPGVIDSEGKLYGKQYLEIEVNITDKKNQLQEFKEIEKLVICPNDRSPRAAYYSDRGCQTSPINLNSYLRKKTYDLPEWAHIEITIRHDSDKYDGNGYSKRFEIILKRYVSFDIEVSFPAGLLVVEPNANVEGGFSNLTGISLAMIAQFSFYHPEKIAKFRPYKIGAGFIGIDALNFNSGRQRLGMVVLGSLYPINRDAKLTFPLYIGAGVFLNDITTTDAMGNTVVKDGQKAGNFFFLLGPGIRVRL